MFVAEIFKAPVFDDEEKAYQAYLLHVILVVLIVVPIPYLAYILAAIPELSARAWVQSIAGETINIFLMVLLRRGHVRAAGLIQTVAFWLFFTVTAFTDTGVMSEAYLFGYPLVILIVGLLLGSRLALGATALCLFSGLGMVIAENTGLIPSYVERPALFTWVISLAIFPVFVVIQRLTSQTTKRATERARRSEERYRLISGVSTDYAFESVVGDDEKGKTVWLGGAFEKMTGYTPEEYIAAGGWYAHIHPDDLVQDDRDMKNLLNNQDVLGSEIRTYTKNGESRWERVYAHPIWDKEKNRLAGIIGAVQDITEQKEAELKMREAFRQQEAILNNIPDMAWLKDLEGQYIAVNNQFEQVSGRVQEEIIGKTDLDIWEAPFAEYYRLDDLEVIQSGKRKTMEEKQKDKNNGEYWVETTKTPIRDEQGRVIGTTGIARDISERKAAEMERERLIAELGAKNAELERFTYTVSHDLKSPLVTITGFLGYLEQDARAGKFEHFERDMNRIRQAADRMQTLLNDLLELSRIGRIINDPVEFEFGVIARDTLTLLDGPLTARKVRVLFSDEGHKVFGDRLRLTEALQNLVENAVKFMGSQPRPEITIGSFKGEDGQPVFFVRDNGIGIALEYQNRIFGLFNKLDANSDGTGIGLTLVKRIIEVHRGRIWLESQPGSGATFYFTLPDKAT
jgi:PAS domain S-box-containing protein